MTPVRIVLGNDEWRALIRGHVIEPQPGVKIILQDIGLDHMLADLKEAVKDVQTRAIEEGFC